MQPLKGIQTTEDKEKFDEQPMSPTTRLLHERGANVYIIAIIGMKTQVNPDVLKANGIHVINKNHRFSSLQVNYSNETLCVKKICSINYVIMSKNN